MTTTQQESNGATRVAYIPGVPLVSPNHNRSRA
jgi:hypothetical protein